MNARTGTAIGLLTVVLVMTPLSASGLQQISGPATVLDGDTLKVAGTIVKLAGVDAPELQQHCRNAAGYYPCGRRSLEFLASFIQGASVSCHFLGNEADLKRLARCHIRSEDVAKALVRSGQAIATDNTYADAEMTARVARVGLWSGNFMRPEQWRATMARTPPVGVQKKR